MALLKTNIKAIIAWCIYDMGISAFPVIVLTFVFPAYFTSKIAANHIIGTHQWGNAAALAGIITAILSPIFGSIANYGGKRLQWLTAFTVLVIVSSILLWYAYPEISSTELILTCLVLGTCAVNISMVFYNAILLDIAPSEYVGRISGWGWGIGYFGGLFVLIIALFGFVKTPPTWLNPTTFQQIRICGPIVALWVFVFLLPMLFIIKTPSSPHTSTSHVILSGLRQLGSTLKTLSQQKMIVIFLASQIVYTDGLNTLFAFGGIYAAGTMHMDLSEILVLGILMNAFAGIGSIVMGWVDDLLGAKATIIISLIMLIIFEISIICVDTKTAFTILACILSLFVGPVQSSSRSLMTQLIPKERATEFFGFYVLSGKVTTFVGPWIFGIMTLMFNSQRAGMASLAVFFLLGVCIVWFVQEPKRRA